MNRAHRTHPNLAALLLGLGLLLASLPAAAVIGSWTAVGSTGVVDESALSFYSFGSTNLGYSPASASVAPIIARFNVTNTLQTSDTPPWNTLELGSFDNSPLSSVRADLIQVTPCTGVQTVLCSVTSNDNAASTCKPCTFTAPINFATNVYYIQVTISRSVATVSPQLLTLKLF